MGDDNLWKRFIRRMKVYNPSHVPRTLHQMWLAGEYGSEPNDAMKELSQGVRDAHMDYKQILWDNDMVDNLLKKPEYSHIAEMYYDIDHTIFRCDLARLVVVYEHGGIYIDLDGREMGRGDLLKDIDVSSGKCLAIYNDYAKTLSLPSKKGAEFHRLVPGVDPCVDRPISNSIIAATPKHPLVMLLIEGIMEWWKVDGKYLIRYGRDLYLKTGPHHFAYTYSRALWLMGPDGEYLRESIGVTGSIPTYLQPPIDLHSSPIYLDHINGSFWVLKYTLNNTAILILKTIAIILLILTPILIIIVLMFRRHNLEAEVRGDPEGYHRNWGVIDNAVWSNFH